MDLDKVKHRVIRRFGVELSAAAVIIIAFLAFRDSTDILIGLLIIYLICLSVIYAFRKGT